MANVTTEVLMITGICGTNRMYRTISSNQLAWWLREHNYEVQVIDYYAQLSNEQLLELVDHFVTKETKIIGWSTMGTVGNVMGQSKRFVETLLPILKEKYPWVVFITGGASVHYTCSRYPNGTGFDYHFFGYAENGVLSLCNTIFRKAPMVVPEKKNGNRVIRETTICPLTQDETFDVKELKHRWHDRDCILPNDLLPIEVGRGCIFKCKFCAYPHTGKKKGEYSRQFELIEEEILDNYARFGTTMYHLVDDTFNDDPDKVKAFWEMSQRLPFKIHLAAFIRADLLQAHPDEQYQLLESGFIGTYFGIESFGPTAAKFVAKPWSYKNAQDFLVKLRHDIWKEEVNFRCSMITGLPGDTRKDYLKWHKWFVEHEIPNWHWHALYMQRDLKAPFISNLEKDAEEYGYTWVTENGKNMWKNKESGITQRDAMEIEAEMNALKAPHQVNVCFSVLEECQYLGLNPKVHNFTKIKDIKQEALQTERDKSLQLYIQKMLSL